MKSCLALYSGARDLRSGLMFALLVLGTENAPHLKRSILKVLSGKTSGTALLDELLRVYYPYTKENRGFLLT